MTMIDLVLSLVIRWIGRLVDALLGMFVPSSRNRVDWDEPLIAERVV